jgi:glycosyltransferase involved in cell wall biosynthesis
MQNLDNISDRYSYDMIVFCHLRWEFVYQRPQHIISRMSAKHKILFVEEPVGRAENTMGGSRLLEINPNLHVLQPHVDSIPEITGILSDFVPERNIEIGWFYSPAFESLSGEFNFSKIVYDCMDELSMFKGASAELLEQEKRLLEQADVVFTGGKSLFEAKSKLHENVFCFPSSVDFDHFAQAMNGVAVPDDIAAIPQPIAGYYGVIDERIDTALIEQMASASPSVSFVMIGPLAKITEEELPKAPNIYYLGMKSYEELPGYLKAFRIAMMPFAMNEATRYISPTKTLEFMAGNKPIISTPVYDVVRDYSHCVAIAPDAHNFSKAITRILEEPVKEQLDPAFDAILKATSWDTTVEKMNSILSENKVYEEL